MSWYGKCETFNFQTKTCFQASWLQRKMCTSLAVSVKGTKTRKTEWLWWVFHERFLHCTLAVVFISFYLSVVITIPNPSFLLKFRIQSIVSLWEYFVRGIPILRVGQSVTWMPPMIPTPRQGMHVENSRSHCLYLESAEFISDSYKRWVIAYYIDFCKFEKLLCLIHIF